MLYVCISLQLEEQAQLVLEENVVLMERQELQNNKLKDLSKFYTEQGRHFLSIFILFCDLFLSEN